MAATHPGTDPQSATDNPLLGFYNTAIAFPERIAIVGPDGDQVPYGKLGARVNRISRWLLSHGLGREDAIAVMEHNGVEFLELLLATQQIGRRLVPVNTHLAPAEVSYILKDSETQLLIAHADLAERLATETSALPVHRFVIGDKVAGWSDYQEVGRDCSAEAPEDRTSGTVMGYTSGTTGRPKGVKRPLRGVAPEMAILMESTLAGTLGFRPGEGVYLSCSPLYHSAPLGFAMAALHYGHTLVVHRRFDAEAALRDIELHRVTASHMVPTHFQRMLKLPADVRSRYDLSSLKLLIHAGAPCPVDVKQRMIDWVGPIVWEYLGGTEGLVSMVTPQEWLAKPGTVGKPYPGTQVHILDDDGGEVPAGEAGVIFFTTPGRSFEYHNDPVKTAASRHGDMFTSGDYGYLDEDGYLFMLDRRDDLILSGGVNIYPAEIEHFMANHPAVDDIAVIGIPDEEWGQRVLAVVKPSPGAIPGDALAEELKTYSATGLASYKRPRIIRFREDFPRTESGKLQRRRLRDEYS
jgi:long-chain acyl-CoA synthetase